MKYQIQYGGKDYLYVRDGEKISLLEENEVVAELSLVDLSGVSFVIKESCLRNEECFLKQAQAHHVFGIKPYLGRAAKVEAKEGSLTSPITGSVLEVLQTVGKEVKAGDKLLVIEAMKLQNEIAAPFEISQPAVSRHLKVLERAGLIERDVDKQRRPARLKAENMAAAVDWFGEFREFWGTSFDQLDDVLSNMKQNSGKDEFNE